MFETRASFGLLSRPSHSVNEGEGFFNVTFPFWLNLAGLIFAYQVLHLNGRI